ncbi:MAG: hypothetical protein AAGH70_08035 [Pseudomonadota bacterium]
MSLPALSRLRESLAGCELALLIDADAQTCLLSAGAVQSNQEQLEGLCKDGVFCVGLEGGAGPVFCVLSGPLDFKVFARAAHQPEALCLVFAPTALPEGLEGRLLDFLMQDVLADDVGIEIA